MASEGQELFRVCLRTITHRGIWVRLKPRADIVASCRIVPVHRLLAVYAKTPELEPHWHHILYIATESLDALCRYPDYAPAAARWVDFLCGQIDESISLVWVGEPVRYGKFALAPISRPVRTLPPAQRDDGSPAAS